MKFGIDSPLVLTENEATVGGKYDHWDDVTGERYHYPNKYRKRIVTGRAFVYYKGSRSASGARIVPEYFGCGRIGTIYADQSVDESIGAKGRRWYCEIDEYQPFSTPVPFKLDGVAIEGNAAWQDAVRVLSWEKYRTILELASCAPQVVALEVPDANLLQVVKSADGLMIAKDLRANPKSIGGSLRRSPYARLIGNHCEELVLKYLASMLQPSESASLRWHANLGETPGYDISFVRSSNKIRVGIEVKGTTASRFPNIEVTAQEWTSAESMRANYWLALVADCFTDHPKIEILEDPFGMMQNGKIQAKPLSWKLERTAV